MDQDVTWYGVGLGPGHIVLDGDPAAPTRKAEQQPTTFRPTLLWHCCPSQPLLSSCRSYLAGVWSVVTDAITVAVFDHGHCQGDGGVSMRSDAVISHIISETAMRYERSGRYATIRYQIAYASFKPSIKNSFQPKIRKNIKGRSKRSVLQLTPFYGIFQLCSDKIGT